MATSKARKAGRSSIKPATSVQRTPSRPPAIRQEEPNQAPSQWGRRLARLVGDKFGVKMSENHAKNEGVFGKKDIVIKCAKSIAPPIFVLTDMLDRIDEVWAVYILDDDTAQVWAITVKQVREHAYFTHGPNVQSRAEIYLRQIQPIGKLVGTLTEEEVESCRIP